MTTEKIRNRYLVQGSWLTELPTRARPSLQLHDEKGKEQALRVWETHLASLPKICRCEGLKDGAIVEEGVGYRIEERSTGMISGGLRPIGEIGGKGLTHHTEPLAIPLHREQGEQFYCAEYDKNGYTCETQCNHCASTPAGKEEETDMVYCNWCKCVTLQVSETTGMRCQKCYNQNPYDNCSQKEFETYMVDMIRFYDWRNVSDITKHFDKNREELKKFLESKLPSPQSEQAGEKVGAAGEYAKKEYPRNPVPGQSDFNLVAVYENAFLAGALWQAASQEKGWVAIADKKHWDLPKEFNNCTFDVLVEVDNPDSPVAVAFFDNNKKQWWLSAKDDIELFPIRWRSLSAPDTVQGQEGLTEKWNRMQADIQLAMDKWDDEQRGKAQQAMIDLSKIIITI